MPKQLLAAAPRKAVLESYEDRPVKPNEVKVQVLYAAPKHGSELADFRGDSPHQAEYYDETWRLFLPRSDGQERERAAFRQVNLGNQWVGVIVEAGPEVKDYAVGERVCGYGGIRETHIAEAVDNGSLWKMPEHMSWKSAVCLNPALFAIGGERRKSFNP